MKFGKGMVLLRAVNEPSRAEHCHARVRARVNSPASISSSSSKPGIFELGSKDWSDFTKYWESSNATSSDRLRLD